MSLPKIATNIIYTRIFFFLRSHFLRPKAETVLLEISSSIKSRTIVYGFAISSLGTYLLANVAYMPDFSILSRLLVSVYMIALATYLYNDLTDFQIDRVNQRTTVYSEEKLQYYTTFFSVAGFFITSIILAFSVNFLTGLGSLAFCGLGIAYSHPKIHLKDRFVIKTIVTGIGGFIASLMGSFAAENFSLLVIASSVIVFLFYFVNGPLNDIRDIHGDQKGGRSTIPIVLGIDKSFAIIIITIISIAIVVVLSYLFLEVHLVGMIIGIAICGYVIKSIVQLSKNYNDKSKMNSVRTLVRNSILFVQLSLWVGILVNNIL